MNQEDETLLQAEKHLCRRDPVLRRLIRTVGSCTLQCDTDHFAVLTKSIVSQQLSTKAAATIHGRLVESIQGRKLNPKNLLALSDETLQLAGLSRAKRIALRDLASKVHAREIRFHKTGTLTDEEIIECLVQVKGIGRWTAEMFLIFSMGRLDILPIADLGLRAGVQQEYGLTELPDKSELEKIAEPWQPYRSIATWYIWRSRGIVAKAKKGVPKVRTRAAIT